jgi:putative hydrolase of the HAD superfamily
VREAIRRTSRWYWADPDRHRAGRLELDSARREVVALALATLGIDDGGVADRIAQVYSRERDARMELLPDAVETVRWFRAAGARLALLTNGGAAAQRAKVERFGLRELFDEILIEGEVGYGKPDPRVYELALQRLGAAPEEAWMVGDNLEWDVTQPQKLGLVGIWIDVRGTGVPEPIDPRPHHVVRALSEVRAFIAHPAD